MLQYENLVVDGTIAPEDEMFKGDREHYFGVGQSAITNIQRAISWAYPEARAIERILDFPCGHGRVMRFLKAAYPKAELTGCDLNRRGVDFCAAAFGAIAVYSEFDPTEIRLPRDHYDLIWVGSLFTHLDATRWRVFLTYLSSLLKPGGLLIFSTQGRTAYDWMGQGRYMYGLDEQQVREIRRQYEMTGFGYVDYRDQPDYGITITEPAWACRMITSLPPMRVVGYGEKSWDGHHDVVACVKDTEWMATGTPEGLNQISFTREISRIPQALRLGYRALGFKRSA